MKATAKQLTMMLENRLQTDLNNFPSRVQEYEKYRQKIVEQQLRNNISSVYWEQVSWKGEVIRFPVISSELEPFPRDWKICARYKQKLTNKFLDFGDKWQFPIVEEFDLYNKINQNYIDFERVREISDTYRWGQLIGEDGYQYHPHLKKFVQTYQIVFTNLVDHNLSSDDEETTTLSALHSLQIPVNFQKS